MRPILVQTLLLAFAVSSFSVAQSPSEKTHGPDCSGGWPTNIAFVNLKNAGLVDNRNIDWSVKSNIKTVRIASEKIGKGLWHQVYDVAFKKTSGETIEAIVVHDASFEECSMTSPDVYVVSKHIDLKRP
jgi:hypothetical protein